MTTIEQSSVAAALDALDATAGHWTIDPVTSTFELRGRYVFGAAVTARFAIGSGSVEIAADRSAIEGTLLLDAESLNSGIALRDQHLRERRSALDVERFPTIRFDLERITPGRGGTFAIAGAVTIREVTQPVELQVDVHVYAEHAHLAVTGTVQHRAFKIPMPALGRDLTVHARLRAVPA